MASALSSIPSGVMGVCTSFISSGLSIIELICACLEARLGCQVSLFVASKAFVWGPSSGRHLVGLCCVSICTLPLLSQGAHSVTCVHWHGHVIHPLRGIGRVDLSWCEVSEGLLWPPLLEAWRVIKALEVWCVFVTILPHFSTFSTHVTSVSHTTHHVHPACASKSWDLFSLTLHSHALSSLPTFLFGSLWLCHGFLSHFSDSFVYDSLVPFSTIHLPYLVCFLIPVYATGTSHFTFIRNPMLLSLIQYYT